MGLGTPVYGDIQAAGFQFFFVSERCFFIPEYHRIVPKRFFDK